MSAADERLKISEQTATRAPGRLCPIDYRYAPESLNRQPDLTADVVYVVGGLYGNLPALRIDRPPTSAGRVKASPTRFPSSRVDQAAKGGHVA